MIGNKTNFACVTFLLVLAAFSSCSSYSAAFSMSELKAECAESSIEVYNDNPYITLMPQNPRAGFVFYPGGLVSYEAYLPLLVKCAKLGVACVLVQMPSDFAILDMNEATRVLNRYPQIEAWYLGGHSLGGAMTASYISSNAAKFRGLVLLAAYSTEDLSQTSLKVLSVYGSNDKVLNMENYEKYRANLPPSAVERVIEGGNHGHFADYGEQKGDGEATVESSVQQQLTAGYISNLIDSES